MKKYCLVDDVGSHRNYAGGWYTLKNIIGYGQKLYIASYKECFVKVAKDHSSYKQESRFHFFNGRCRIHIVPVEAVLVELAEIKLKG